jgi:tetratricopeptide (TPR) repeat protein
MKKEQCPYCEKILEDEVPVCPICNTSLESIWGCANMANEYLKKGYFLYKQGSILAALECVNTAITLNNQLVQAPLLLGKIYYDIGLNEYAKKYWEQAGKFIPEDPEIKKLVRQCGVTH